jgi:hypothetical protein
MNRSTCIVLVLSLAAISLSCSDTVPTDPLEEDVPAATGSSLPWERRFVDRTSPDALLEYLETSYGNELLLMYADALDDSFLFEFTPEDADNLGLPPDQPWWEKLDDVTSTGNMFDNPEVVDVQMDLPRSVEWFACIDSYTGRMGLCTIVDPDIRVTIQAPGEDPMILWVNNSLLDVMVVEDPDCPALWIVQRMEETVPPPGPIRRTDAPGLATEPMTWGSIKGMFK